MGVCVWELFYVLNLVCGNGSARAYVLRSATGGWVSMCGYGWTTTATEEKSDKHLTR